MPDWQITAKTVYCESVDDEVTWLVFQNGSTHCTGCKKYGHPNAITRRVIRMKTRRLQRPIQCAGENCSRVALYQQQILAEEQNG